MNRDQYLSKRVRFPSLRQRNRQAVMGEKREVGNAPMFLDEQTESPARGIEGTEKQEAQSGK